MWGQIAGAVIGGVMSNRAAKKQANAINAANQASNAGYLDAQPYIRDMYRGGTDALNSALDAGYYNGPTYAGMNNMSEAGYNQMYNTGVNASTDAANFLNTGRGFGNNYADIYGRASQDMLGNAINYASDSANYQPLLDAVMSDDRRNMDENVLRNNAMNSSMTGNTNSSRSAVMDAIAERGYEDRRAKAATDIQNSLINRSLNTQQNQLANMTNANKNLAGLYNTGMNQMNNASSNMVGAGNAFQSDLQRQYNDNRANFEGNRDFEMDMYNQYNAGILGRAPQTAAKQNPNLVDPNMAALSGGMAGFGFGQKYGGQIQDFFSNMMPAQGNAYQPAVPYGAAGGRAYGVNNNIYGF